jgi:hypothetical protein
MGSSASVWVLNVAMFLGGPCPVARLLVDRASMTGRGLRRSDGPRCCRFLASAPLAQKRVRIRPTDVRLVVGPVRPETRQRLSEAVWGAFGDQGSVCARRRPRRYRTGRVGSRELRATCRQA